MENYEITGCVLWGQVEMMTGAEQKTIKIADGVAIIAGMVIGPGIFKTPSLVAANSSGEFAVLMLWVLGGLISFSGALCYAELSSTYPNAGGEYYYLSRSFGRQIGFLFAWARMTVIQTGSIAMLSFIIGDYASDVLNLGPYSSSLYAMLTVFLLTAINLKGIRFSSSIQKILLTCLFTGLMLIIITGLALAPRSEVHEAPALNTGAVTGQALIFILLTYGGWNEASYISTDVGRKSNDIVKVLIYSIGLITVTYLITNLSLIRGLGFDGVSSSSTVAADLIGKVLGSGWVSVISIIISVAALSTVNAVMITGARTNYALGRDFSIFRFLAGSGETLPANAFLFQSGISILLIFLGTAARSGFTTMVEYTAPVFWLFFLLVGISLFTLRRRENGISRPFSVPLYPVVPFIFCLAAAYMLYASLVYTGAGAVIGVAVLLTGIPFLLLQKYKSNKASENLNNNREDNL